MRKLWRTQTIPHTVGDDVTFACGHAPTTIIGGAITDTPGAIGAAYGTGAATYAPGGIAPSGIAAGGIAPGIPG